MQIDTAAGLAITLTFGIAAYFDNRARNVERTSGSVTEDSRIIRSLGAAIAGIVGTLLIGASVYLFTQVPVLLWEITAGFVLGSLTLRLLRISSQRFF